ncbi:hypothetical protein U0070_027325 [Myodes glareolus]|uniref:Uncharacterized protein n=1 Tax=Myodes glareolus TaxID=447135 RepID=A0AAW0HWH9_MYOGA
MFFGRKRQQCGREPKMNQVPKSTGSAEVATLGEAHRGPTQSVETRELHLIPKRNLEKKKKSTGTVREKHREASPTIQTARVTTTKRERLTRHVG